MVQGMTSEMDHIVLEHLRHIRTTLDGMREEMRQSNLRLGIAEHSVAVFRLSEVGQNAEIDRIKARLERVERRLDLTE